MGICHVSPFHHIGLQVRQSMPIKERLEMNKMQSSWSFKPVSTFTLDSPLLQASDVIGTIDYQETERLIATGGIARKIRILSYDAVINRARNFLSQEKLATGLSTGSTSLFHGSEEGRDMHTHASLDVISDSSLLTTICTPAKLSSLKWKPGTCEVVGCGDYDGSVMEWDIEEETAISERFEHGGKRVFSVHYNAPSSLLASASADGTVRLWTSNCDTSVGVITSPGMNSMCCAEFSPFAPHQIAIACADSNIYVHDIRNLAAEPLLCFQGHRRAVSYVKWLSKESIVSASTDTSIKTWDLNTASCSSRTFNAHINMKHFVGLDVVRPADSGSGGALVASGSEDNEVVVYDCNEKLDDAVVYRHKFSGLQQAFVGAVCWTRQEDHVSLLAANSKGTMSLIQARSATPVIGL